MGFWFLFPKPNRLMDKFTLSVTGENQTAQKAPELTTSLLHLERSIVLTPASRSGARTNLIEIDDKSLIEIELAADGSGQSTSWMCSPDTFLEIFPRGLDMLHRSGEPIFEVPLLLDDPEPERGLGSVFVKVINIFTKKKIVEKVASVALKAENSELSDAVGLYRLDQDFNFLPVPKRQSDNPYLLFLHGTASSTMSSFGAIRGSEVWSYIIGKYGENILAFQHRTLTESPLQNAYQLIDQLPDDATVHIVSHSRGGIVGDLLSKFFGSTIGNSGFSDIEMAFLQKSERENDIQQIKEIKRLIETRKKRIRVEKFVRVACPANGTILASKRLDHVLNMILNLIGLTAGGSIVYSALKELLVTVIDSKNDQDVLPGLEAMNPSSPFIKTMNSRIESSRVSDALAVIAGNCRTGLNLKALKVLASKLFFLRDNDLVVNSNAMLQGVYRKGNIQYMYDDRIEVDHFSYFANKRSQEALRDALSTVNGDAIPGFVYIDQTSREALERNALLKLEGGEVPGSLEVSGTKPIVVLLPGIMGSTLSEGKSLFWIQYGRFLAGDLTDLGAPGLKATGLVATSYEKLVTFLRTNYDVVTFPFDWRMSLELSANVFNEVIKKLLVHNQPIKIIGHSMGGVLVRDFILNHDDTWQKLNNSNGFRLIFLGAPLGGSFRIPAVLMGQDAIIEKLALIDIFHTKKELLKTFVKFPGLLNLLPLTKDPGNDFANEETWKAMVYGDQLDRYWPIPGEGERSQFAKYREKVIAGMNRISFKNASYIAGKDKSTPCGYRFDGVGNNRRLVFLSTGEGDQSVTWKSGIPPQLPANSVYYVNVSHGALANDQSIFPGIADLLANGTTSLLKQTRPAVRSAEQTFKMPPHDNDVTREGILKTLLGISEVAQAKATGDVPTLHVAVSHGQIKYAAHPLLCGHFDGDGILQAESVIDSHLKGMLSRRLELGLYPGAIGTSEIFPSETSSFNGAIIVGLGDFGKLTSHQLSVTVEQGVTKFLLMANDKNDPNARRWQNKLGISTLAIGSAYGGLPLENSLRGIIQGVQRANKKIRKFGNGARVIDELEVIELYGDKALSCFYVLSQIEKNNGATTNIAIGERKITEKPGGRERIALDFSSGWWTRINVAYTADKPSKRRCLQFTVAAGEAQQKLQHLFTNPKIIDGLLKEFSTTNTWSDELARTIFELLIPNAFKDDLTRQNNIVWIVENETAWYPWELLQASPGSIPMAVNSGMVRQLATENFREKVKGVTTKDALIVADPILEGFLNQLPHARAEGKSMASVFAANNFNVTTKIESTAGDITKALFSKDYKIIHLAGHGLFDENPENGSGMVIGPDTYLSSFEIAQMSTVPELVFLNCCYLGSIVGEKEAAYQKRYKLAANIGTQLIINGVKAVVAAGWAVHDGAAMEFAAIFYQHMFAGWTFGDAVRVARSTIYERYPETNTWGAYQCYGDPQYRLSGRSAKSGGASSFVIAKEAEIALDNLRSSVLTGEMDVNAYQKQLTDIMTSVEDTKLTSLPLLEKEALLYGELFLYDPCIKKFGELESKDKFSDDAMERYYNIAAKSYILAVRMAVDTESKKITKQKLAKFTAAENNKALVKLDALQPRLYNLLRVNRTFDRLAGMGSFYKRKAAVTNDFNTRIRRFRLSAYYYYEAHNKPTNQQSAYTLSNWSELEVLLSLASGDSWKKNVTIQIDPVNEDGFIEKVSYSIPSRDVFAADLTKLRSVESSTINYIGKMARANVELALFMISPSTFDDSTIETIVGHYREAWETIGSRGRKFSEIEHLDILIDFTRDIIGRKQQQRSTPQRRKLADAKVILKALESIRSKLTSILTTNRSDSTLS
jgi:pimeloyl-ACP methyl ester carboxylesterase